MKFLDISLKDLAYVLTLLGGFAAQWGVLSTKVAAVEGGIKEVSSVKESIARLDTYAIRNYDAIVELQKDMKTVLMRLPR